MVRADSCERGSDAGFRPTVHHCGGAVFRCDAHYLSSRACLHCNLRSHHRDSGGPIGLSSQHPRAAASRLEL